MDERDVRISRLSRARRADSDERRHRVLAIIEGLAAGPMPMPITELARRANVHRSFLYRHPDLYGLAVATPLHKQLAELEDERDRLQAVVDLVKEYRALHGQFWLLKHNEEEAVAAAERESHAWSEVVTALDALDTSAEVTDG